MDITGNKTSIAINVVILAAVLFLFYKLFSIFGDLFGSDLSKKGQAGITKGFPSYTAYMTKAKTEYAKKSGKKAADIKETDVNFLKWLGSQIGKTTAEMLTDAKTIYNAKATLKDNEESIYSVLKTYKTKTGIAALSFIFEQYSLSAQEEANAKKLLTGDVLGITPATKIDLAAYIVSFTNDSQLKVCTDIIKKLPDFID